VISGDDKWFTVCNVILAAAKAGLSKQAGRYLITTGQIAWDDCCDGQLAVSLARTSPTEAFPTEAVNAIGLDCSPAYEIGEITIQITRCAPQPVNGANAPSPDALTKHARQTMIDANEIKRTVTAALCALREDVSARFDYFVRAQLMLGPEGACDGSELYVYAGLAVG
jgi:hypothetical protein